MFQNLHNLFSGDHFENITYKTSQYPQNIFVKKKLTTEVSTCQRVDTIETSQRHSSDVLNTTLSLATAMKYSRHPRIRTYCFGVW